MGHRSPPPNPPSFAAAVRLLCYVSLLSKLLDIDPFT